MKVIVGSHNGQMKIINLDENAQTDLYGKYGLNNAVEILTWASEKEDLYAAGFTDGKVQLWNPLTRRLEHDCGQRAGKIKGLFTFDTESGRQVVSCTDTKLLDICPAELPEDHKFTPTRLHGNNESAIWRMRVNPISHQHIMYMGYGIMPTLYDFEKGKTVWVGEFGHAKFYGLKQKQFFTDFQFMPNSASVLITGSRYREFRIFDLREGNKPVMFYDVSKTSEWEFAMISLGVTDHTPTLVYATEATGKIASFDLRTGRLHRVFRDGMGTVKQLAFHPTERCMGAVSLDRYLRVYDIDKRLQKFSDKTSLEYKVRIQGTFGANMHNKLFLKQKLSSLLFFSEGRAKKVLAEKAEENENERERKRKVEDEEMEEINGDDSDDDVKEIKMKKAPKDDDDELWGGMEQVGDVKTEDSDDDLIKDEPESDDDEDEKPSKATNGKTKVKAEDDELLWDDDEEGEEEESEDEINLGEFNDDDVIEGEGEEKDSDDEEEEGDEEEGGDEEVKSEATKKKKGEKKTDNKRVRRKAQEKLEKQKLAKQKKANIKKDKFMAKKRKLLK